MISTEELRPGTRCRLIDLPDNVYFTKKLKRYRTITYPHAAAKPFQSRPVMDMETLKAVNLKYGDWVTIAKQ